MCATCLNPELKVEKLYHLKFIKKANLEEVMKTDDDFSKFVKEIKLLSANDKDITFSFWTKIPIPKSKKGLKVSRKVVRTLKMKALIKELIVELEVMKEHLFRAHMQFRAFKAARQEAISNLKKLTNVDSVSLHAMYAWSMEGKQSYIAVSNCTIHAAEAVWASIEPILIGYVKNGINFILIVSDSPTSQYRNKKVFWYV